MNTVIIISPAKEMREFDTDGREFKLDEKTKNIIELMQNKNQEDYIDIFKCSENIAKKSYETYKNIYNEKRTPAIFAYNGISFKHISPENLKKKEIDFLDKNLRILSALYGPLCPMDLIYSYRMDFKTDIKLDGKTLTNYWKDYYNTYFEKFDLVLNLASKEFSSLIDRKKVNVFDIEFVTESRGKFRQLSTSSKIARGEMVRYLAKTGDLSIENIKKFTFENFSYDEKRSDDTKAVFISLQK